MGLRERVCALLLVNYLYFLFSIFQELLDTLNYTEKFICHINNNLPDRYNYKSSEIEPLNMCQVRVILYMSGIYKTYIGNVQVCILVRMSKHSIRTYSRESLGFSVVSILSAQVTRSSDFPLLLTRWFCIQTVL